MHHLHPSSKGDQLCPLGFHPQVRWPTRCKRCFRDYKEHGGRRGGDDVAASSPSLTDSSNTTGGSANRIWTSTQNLSSNNNNNNGNNADNIELRKRPVSWTSTPDLDKKKESNIIIKKIEDVETSLKVQIPQRRHTTTLDAKELEESFTMRRPPIPPTTITKDASDDTVILKTDSLAERVRKMNLLKKQNSAERESSRERSISREKSLPRERPKIEREPTPPKEIIKPARDPRKRLSLQEPELTTKKKEPVEIPLIKELSPNKLKKSSSSSGFLSNAKKEEDAHKKDIQFLMHVKDKNQSQKQDDSSSLTTETTDTTIIGGHRNEELHEEIKKLQSDYSAMKTRAERAERDKSDLLLRRLASLDTGTNRTAASEALKLQQKVNEMKGQVEELRDDKKNLSLKLRDMEQDLKNRAAKSVEDELKRKLRAAEQLCEELIDENSDIKKELHGIETEMDEMHDSFREDQAAEYNNVKKELDLATKNCRILSFKLKKSERKIESLEIEKQAQTNSDLMNKVKKLEDDLKLANELSRRLQIEADQHKDNPTINKKAPLLGVVGKSTSADGRYSRASLTRGGSQEDPQQLLRDLQDSIEREADLKEQLKFAEEEAENVRKKATRIEDENESLMMQLKKMASRARSRKLSPTPPSRLTPEPPIDRDEGISDEDDPAELRVLLELNEQESAVLRLKVEDLENENKENKNQIKELQEKLKTSSTNSKKPFSSLLSSSKNSTTAVNEKKLKMLEDEMAELRKSIIEKDRSIEQLQAEIKAAKMIKKPFGLTNSITDNGNIDAKKQLQVVEQEASILRNKIISLEKENEKISLENKKLLMQSVRKNSIPTTTTTGDTNAELAKVKDSLQVVEMERDLLKSKLKVMRLEAENILPPHIPKEPTEMITRPTLKRWVDELENEIYDLRTMIWNCSAEKQTKLENENYTLQAELKDIKEKLDELKKSTGVKESTSKITELEQKLKKSEDETKKLSIKSKELEEKIKRQESLVKNTESSKNLIDAQLKREKEKSSVFEKDLDKEKKDRQKSETKVTELNDELTITKKSLEKIKSTLEKEIKELKSKVGSSVKSDILPSTKQLQDLRKQNEDLLGNIAKEMKKYTELNAKYESITEENILVKAQLAMEKKNFEVEKNSTKQHLFDMDKLKSEKSELIKKLKDAEKKMKEIEARSIKSGASEYEKTMLKNNLAEKDVEYIQLKKENEMNIEIVFQLRKENDDLNKKLNDFTRINKVQTSMNDHNQNLEAEIRKLRMRLENVELNSKSEVASTRLRYEQQVKNLNVEINAMQRQCERFKKDRDAFKQLLESAQKQIGDLKQNSGRQSRGSMHSGDEDDLKGKILFLEQQIGCLEDQLCESRLDASKFKNQLISERTANEIKISEMTSKVNEFEEERLIATGRSKIAGMKTKLELSWQKEREEQQRILQETSTLARDLRQTLFEVERERDKERLELKRKLDQVKKSQEEELEEGRKKVSELQCDLLELRDAHAKLRTSNEKLRRERERNERELAKRRMEHDGERKVGALLQTVDELVKIAPDLKMAANASNRNNNSTSNNLKPELVNNRRSRSPSPNSASQISHVLARLAEASEELRKYQQYNEEENERNRVRRGNLRRATSTENDGSSGISRTPSTGKLSRSSHNGSLIRKSLSLDQTNKQDQSIWRQEDGSMSSIQSIDSEMGGGLVRDSDLDSRLSGGSTQSDVPRGPRKKKRGIMGKLRSLTKSGRNAESEGSMQGSDSDVSMSNDARSSKKDLRNRLSGMFKRAGSVSRSGSTEKMLNDSEQRPVAVTIVGGEDGPKPLSPPTNATTPKSINRTSTVTKPPTPTTPITKRRIIK